MSILALGLTDEIGDSMKKLGYLFFAWIYNICSLLFRTKAKILFFNGHDHGFHGNLQILAEEWQKKHPEDRQLIYSKRDLFSGNGKGFAGKLKGCFCFFVQIPFHMATAKQVYLNDNFLPLAFMHTEHKKTQFIQLWHGAGAFKRFGLSTEEKEEVRRLVTRANEKITHLFVTSEQVKPYYQEAFAISENRIYATGIPATDLYFDKEAISRRKKTFYEQYPDLRKKKILLYAPTFRGTMEENAQILKEFQVDKIHEILGEEWVILVKMHPKFPVENIIENVYCRNMTNYNDITDLYLVADLFITDYSSTVVEYVLLDKPVILYAYDLEKYDRGFYRDYEKTAPGEVAHSKEELYQILSQKQDNLVKRQTFVKLQYDYSSGGSTERILQILGKE